MSTSTSTSKGMKPATDVIAELRGGACNEQLAAAINEATERVKVTGKPCTVTLKLRIENADKEATSVDRVFVQDHISTKLAAMPQKNSLFFIHPDNSNLMRTDPQMRLPGLPSETKAAG